MVLDDGTLVRAAEPRKRVGCLAGIVSVDAGSFKSAWTRMVEMRIRGGVSLQLE